MMGLNLAALRAQKSLARHCETPGIQGPGPQVISHGQCSLPHPRAVPGIQRLPNSNRGSNRAHLEDAYNVSPANGNETTSVHPLNDSGTPDHVVVVLQLGPSGSPVIASDFQDGHLTLNMRRTWQTAMVYDVERLA